MGDYFNQGEDEKTSTEGSSASLSEFNSLSNLVVLFLEINAKFLSRDLDFICNKLLRYDISVNRGSAFSYVSKSRKGALTVKDIEAASLITFKSLYHTLEYLCLEEVTDCDSILPSIDKGGLNKLVSLELNDCKDLKCLIDTTQMHVPAPAFSNLVKLSLRRLNLLREICWGPYEKLQSVSLENCETIDVEECVGMCSLFPAMLLQRLYKLKEVAIRSCNKLEEIFQLDGLCHSREENLAVLSSLAKLYLAALPQLRCIWKGPTHIVNLKSLTDVEVTECKSLIYLFTLSVAQSLVQLKSLKVSDCESLKHLLMTEGDNDKEEEILSESHHATVVLPNLAKLSIENLPQLKCIWNGPSYNLNLPSLIDVEVTKCKSLTYLFTLSYFWSLVRLKSLEIARCENLEHLVITKEGNNENGEEISSEHDLQIQSPFLSKLESLKIYSCERLEHIFPVSFARVLVQLEKFTVENAPQLKQVFYLDNGSEENIVAGDGKETVVIKLPKLKVLILDGLASMISFCPKNFHSSWPALEDFTIEECSNLSMSFVTEVVSKVRDLQELQHLEIFDCGELEEIIVEEDEDNQILFFQNLLEINVRGCPKIRRLFGITIAPGLQKLKKIGVSGNSELEEVFGDKDVANVMDHKEIVLLPQLDTLILIQLPSLTKFCPVGYHFIFPSLTEILVVAGCPKISTRFFLDQDKFVHAKAKALKDEIADFPSEPSINIFCLGFEEIQARLPLYIENDEQSIKQKEEEINIET